MATSDAAHLSTLQGSADPSPPLADGSAHIRLACQACQRKKIKCDRTFPCGQCVKSSLECVASSRKQRARHVGRRAVDSELRSRIAKLESLVETLSGDSNQPSVEKSVEDANRSTPSRTPSIDVESPQVGRYVASTFWSSLSTEMAALREALEEDDNDETVGSTPDGPVNSPEKVEGSNTFEHDLIICPPGRIYVMPGVMEDLSPHVKAQLNSYFLRNVEKIMKVFHTASIKALIEEDAPYLGHQAGSPQHDALKRMAWFSALNSLSETEALLVTGQPKADVLPKYRRYVEILLSQSDVINTNDLATLQCFLLFTAVCRSTDSSRRTWTMLAMLVRIGQAMGLNHEDSRATPFIREMRRRLWHYIRFFDIFSALDRGTIPLIRQEEFTIPLPTITDDHLFGPDSTSVPIVTGRLSDMGFSIMCMESCNTIEALLMPEFKPSGMTWEDRYRIARDLDKKIETEFLIHWNLEDPYHRLQYSIGRAMSTAMQLRAVRPMQRHMSSVPPPVSSPYVLQLAIDNLKDCATLSLPGDLEGWRWMKWVPWHSLACALAGLCSIRGTELADNAWKVVEPGYRWCGRYVADSQDGMLWRPIAKLYRKACAFRDADPGRSIAKIEPPVEQSPIQNVLHSATTEPVQPGQFNFQQQTAGLDHLSSNFSNLTPFIYSAQYEPGAQAPNNLVATKGFDTTTNFVDMGWTDWNSVMDAYSDPLALNDASMDTSPAFGDWDWNLNNGQEFGRL